ncbi:hypothetical protein H5410_030965, partial [Solanum commersonii]
MLAKRPHDMPEVQVRQLIEYWKHPTVKAMYEMNSQNRKKQNMKPKTTKGTILKLMFIATRAKIGKKIQANTQVAIAELQNHQNSGKTADDAFRAKDEETNKLKQKHANEITSQKEEMNEMREEMRHLFSQLLQNNPRLNVHDIPRCVGSNLASSVYASSAQAVRGQNLPHSSGAAHYVVLQK